MTSPNHTGAFWSAPFRGNNPINADVSIPGSKSVTNRALILAAQADGKTKLHKPLISRDTELMLEGLRKIGVLIEIKNAGAENEIWEITRGKFDGIKRNVKIDVGNAGTVMRFLPPLAAFANGEIEFDGDARSHERPLGPVIKALEDLGISVEHGGRYSLPMKIKAEGKVRGGEIEVDASKSSQFISALLLIAPSTEIGITIKHIGAELPSMPHIDMTLQMLRDFGVPDRNIEVETNSQSSNGSAESSGTVKSVFKWSVKPFEYIAQDLVIEPDLSNAAPFLSAAMVCGGQITIKDWPKRTTQPGDQLRKILTVMGAKFEFVGNDLKMIGPGLTIKDGKLESQIRGIDINLSEVGELTPAIATLCALANSPSVLRGIGHLRAHETDRLAAIAKEFNSLGGDVQEEPTALHINPKPLHGGKFHTYDDHRLATSAATLGLVVDGIEVENIATTRKTITDFPKLWSSILG